VHRPAPGPAQASIRHVLRAIASERPGPGDRRWLARLQPLIDRRRDVLRHAVAASGRLDDYRIGQARLGDDVVIGLLHLMRVTVDGPADSLAPPLAVAAIGRGARTTAATGSGLDLLFLLPAAKEARANAERITAHVVAALWDLRFAVHYAMRTPEQCRDLARLDVALYAELLGRRLLWGSDALDAALAARLAEIAGETACGTPAAAGSDRERALSRMSPSHASDEISSFAAHAGVAYLNEARRGRDSLETPFA
jgi:hypothetical protein